MNIEELKFPSNALASRREKYIIKAKQLHTASSSSIIVWLSTDETNFNENQTKDKCLIWIGFKDELEALYSNLNNDHAMVSAKCIDDFRKINKEGMLGIYHMTTIDIAQTMFWSIESFVCSIIARIER